MRANHARPGRAIAGARDRRAAIVLAPASRSAAVAAALLAGFVLLAGCGPSRIRPSVPPGGPARSSAAGPGTATGPALGKCAGAARLSAGAAVSGRQLGAIDFLSGRVGVALTAPQVLCSYRPGPGQARQYQEQAQPVRLAVSEDGGSHWLTHGAGLPSSMQSPAQERIVATSARDSWALSDTGVLRSTVSGGASWTVIALPRPVVAIAGAPQPGAAETLWALSCPSVSETSCTPVLDRKSLPGGAWRRVRIPALASAPAPRLAVLSGGAIVLLIARPGNARRLLVSSTDGGASWQARRSPAGPGHLCTADTSITAAGAGNWWLLCAGGFAAGSSTKALLHTTDAGRTWTTTAAVASLTWPARPGSLPRDDAGTLAAGSARQLWLASVNSFAQSTDGGVTWTQVAGVRPQGAIGSLDVRSASQAWLLAPGAGLWHTAGGGSWSRLGAGPGP